MLYAHKIRKQKRVRTNFNLRSLNKYNDRLQIAFFISCQHFSVQLINNDSTQTLASLSTNQKWFRELSEKDKNFKSYNTSGAKIVGEKFGQILKEKFSSAKFFINRGCKKYTGKLKTAVEEIRNNIDDIVV